MHYIESVSILKNNANILGLTIDGVDLKDIRQREENWLFDTGYIQTIDFTNTRDPLFCGVGYPYENIETNQLENIEIPLGIRLNTASYKKFELGFSLGIVGIISNTVIDEYDGVNSFNYFNGIVSCLAEDNISYNAANNVNTQWRNSSYRMDMGLDIQYNLSTAWQIQLAGTWGAFDWKKRDKNVPTNYEILTQEDKTIVSSQTGLRMSLIRGF